MRNLIFKHWKEGIEVYEHEDFDEIVTREGASFHWVSQYQKAPETIEDTKKLGKHGFREISEPKCPDRALLYLKDQEVIELIAANIDANDYY